MTEHVLGNESDVAGFPLTENMSKFVDNLPIELTNTINKISQNKGGAWIVGGAVRDASMGFIPSDIDLATDLRPDKLMSIFPDAIETGLSFGTITIKSGNYLFQTTTLRVDGQYLDSRRPESVEWKLSLNEDLKRRDFTINSMAIDVARRLYYDPNNGIKDIENKIIRCVGNPEKRINEDALRILRAYRFLGQINTNNWKLEDRLSKVIVNNSYLIDDLAKERIWQELIKILTCNKSQEIISLMIRDKILNVIFGWKFLETSKLLSALEIQQNLDYISLFVLVNYHLDKNSIANLCKTLKLSKKDSKSIMFTSQMARLIPQNNIRYLRLYRHLIGTRWRQILRLSKIFDQYDMIDFHNFSKQSYFSKIINEIENLPPLACEQQLIDGKWLMATTNIEQGQKLGRLKEWLYRIQIENDLKKVSEIEEILATLQWQNSDFNSWPRMTLE